VQDQLIPRSLVEISQTSALNVELKVSSTIVFPILLSDHTPLRAPLSKTPRELTLPNKSAARVETLY